METPHATPIDPWNPDRLRLVTASCGRRRTVGRPPRHRLGEAFLKGPISYAWIAAAARLPGSGLHVATTIRFLCDRFRRPSRWGLAEMAEGLGVAERSARRGLHAAEKAGLLSVTREPGCQVVASVLEPAGSPVHPDRSPLYGPIPWDWWHAALRLPGASLQAATACWLVAGWERSAEFALPLGAWAELGLSRQAARRGLDVLEGASLIALTGRSGRTPRVTILRPTQPPNPEG